MLSFFKRRPKSADDPERYLIPKVNEDYGTISKSRTERRESIKVVAKKNQGKPRSLRDLYRYATACDILLIVIGLFGSVVSGAGLPFMAILFGGLASSFMMADLALNARNVAIDNHSLEVTSATGFSTIETPTPDVWVEAANMTINEVLESFNTTIVAYSIYYVMVALIIATASYVQTSCWMICCEHQIHAIRKNFFKCILRREISWFDENQSGELTSQLSDNLERIKEGIGDKLGLLVQYGAQFFAGFAIAFTYNWKLTLALMCLTPFMAITLTAIGRLVAYAARQEHAKYAVAGAIAEEVLSCFRTVIAFNGQKRERTRYEKALKDAKRTGVYKAVFTAASMGILFFIFMSMYAVGLWYGSVLIASGEVEPGTVFIVMMAVMSGSQSLGNTGPQLTALAGARGAAGVIFDIIDARSKIDPGSTSGIKLDNARGRIEFRNVRFAYPSRKEVTVLNEVSFRVESGQCVAIVGASGCGKSTIVNLLLRFYDVDVGEVLLDGANVRHLNLHWLRNLIAVVSQEPILFDATIEENIRFGRINVSKVELIEAAKAANAHSFISTLPEGYRTRVGERGTQLSGGQKQRIAIARALLRKPKVLLLDEATSALDAESESLVQEALDKARQRHTTIVIAHRLSTVRNADKIIALKDGQIAEIGTHEELMAKRGLYYDLVTAQTFETSAEADDEDEDDIFEETDASCTDDQLKSLHPRPRRKTSSFSGPVDLDIPHTRKVTLGKPVETDRQRLLIAAKEEKADQLRFFSILKLARPYWRLIVLGFIGAAVRGVGLPMFSLLFSQMFAVFNKEKDEMLRESQFYALAFVGVGLLLMLGDMIYVTSFGVAAENLTMHLRLRAFTNILRQDASYFDNAAHSAGRLCVRLASDAPVIKGAISTRLGALLTSCMSMVTASVVGFIFGWKLTLLVLLMLPLHACGILVNVKLRERNDNRDALLLEEAGYIAAEAIENIRTVQSLTSEMPVYEKFCRSLEKPYKSALRHTQVQAVSYAFSQCIVFFFYAASFRFGGYLVMQGDMGPLDVFKVFFVIMFCGTTIAWATAYFPEMFKARVAAGLMMKIINEMPRIDSAFEGGLKKEFSGPITFDKVHFSYPSRANVPVLRGMSLRAPFGKTTALVGSSGCGKSTVISLMERFYDPIDGRILISENDLRTFNMQFAREQIALVSQEPTLFDCSIAENIAYGLDDASHERIVHAARLANIHEFVMSLPDGYETRVGEKGVQLSGGQKQRVAIARALVRNPKILLLDEATSALDTENEKVVQEALDKARQGRTCIVVAHRLSTIQNADHIAMLRNGSIIEQGTHSDLIAKRGRYYKLTRKQQVR